MKKKQLSALLIAGVLAVSSPAAVYAADFSDAAAPQETVSLEDTLSDNISPISDGCAAEPDELFQAAPDEEAAVFTSPQEVSDVQATAADASGSNVKPEVYQDGVTYRYMQDKDSYIVDEIYNPSGSKIVILAEIQGKKVTEIATHVYYPTFEDQDEFTILSGDLVLPEGLLVIQAEAFTNSDFISMYIPDSVKEIGSKAFSGSSVRWLHFPAGMPVFPAGFLGGCRYLETIEIPEGVTEIAPGAFKECPALKNLYLPASMTTIGEDLFAADAQVTIHGIPGSYAETYAMEHNLAFSTGKETDPAPTQDTIVQDGVRYTYQKSSDSYLATAYTGEISTEITIPESINGKTVSGIGDNAFTFCYRLSRVNLPSTIKTIGYAAFSKCLGLEEINLPDSLQSIGGSAFMECPLKYALIPDSVKDFGTSIYYGCRRLEEVRLPKGMISIPDFMFYQARLANPLSLPSGLKSIGNNAFGESGCGNMTFPSSLTSIGDDAFNNSSIESVAIPDSVTKMGKEVFSNCWNLHTVNWGKGLNTIPQGTFQSCSLLEEMQLPATVTAIGKYAYNDSAIRRISIPKSVKKIDKTSFTSCENVSLFVKKGSYAETFAKNNKIPYDNGSITNVIAKQDGLRYEYHSSSKTYMLLDADKNIEGDVTIPSAINGKKITAIESSAFHKCDKLRSVKLPDTMKSIGKYAFAYCSSLEEINFPSSLTSIGANAFVCCGLKSVSLPVSVKSIGDSAFSSCEKLEDFQFSKGQTEIPGYMFSGCSSLTKIVLPDTLKKIGPGAFMYTGITTVAFPDSLTYIGDNAFLNCFSLEAAELPKKLTFLGDGAFGSCKRLKQAVIPGSVTEFSDTYYNCSNLEKIEIKTGVEQIHVGAFYSCSSLKELYIPESVYFIGDFERNTLPASCVIYGKSGSQAEEFANSCGNPFISQGASVVGTPVLSRKLTDGNCIRVSLNKRCYNAFFYDYVLTKDNNFPTSGKYLYCQNASQELSQEFNLLDKGTYYVFARANRTLENGQVEYSPWSKPVKTVISTQAPKAPKVKSVTVKGKTVTVVLNKVSKAAEYTCLLAVGVQREGCQKLLVPSIIRYTKSSNTTTLVFKNVSRGKYTVLVKGCAKQKNGTKVSGKWRARTAKVQVK